MIGIQFQGRLGNQLFQYAFALTISKEINVPFYMDQSLQRGLIYKYFHLDRGIDSFLANQIFNITGFKNFFCHYLRIAIYKCINFFLTNKRILYNFENQDQHVVNNKSLLTGYFQSESYFLSNKASVFSQFELKKKWQDKHHARFNSLYNNQKIVTVHIRKSDYENLGHLNLGMPNLSLSLSYYHRVIAQLTVDDYFFIFTSDEPQKIETEFSYIKNKHISYDNEITDFQHMLNADICIIANSTFSWWAAYLNKKSGKTIYAPKYFLGFHIKKTVPKNIYPSNWRLIDAI